jgi:MFS family permease
LKNTPFPEGYQIIFAIGTFGAAMSSYHLYHVRPLAEMRGDIFPPPNPESQIGFAGGIKSLLRLDIWQTPFRSVMLAFLLFHFSQYLPSPIYQLYNVHILHLNDSNIGNGTALYYLAMLIGSTQFRKAAHRYGNKKVTGMGVMGMSFYVFALAASGNVWQFYLLSFFGGFMWALVNGAYANYLLEKIPAHDRPSHLAWYNIILNFAILSSSLIGPAVAETVGLVPALIIFGVVRVLAGLSILKWG